MRPADIVWWGWLLIAAAAAFLGATIGSKAASDPKGGFLPGAVAFISGLVAMVAGFIGVLRFVKWIWEG